MRALSLAVGMLSVSVMAQTAPVQMIKEDAPPPGVLRKATADTVPVSMKVFEGLAASEPDIVAPEGAPRAGVVSMHVLVSKTGAVEEVEPFLTADPALWKAAAGGVMGWRYRPYLVNGEPREIQSMFVVRFRDGVGTRMAAVSALAGANLASPLRGATADTVPIAQSMLLDLAVSEPDIVAPESAQPGTVRLMVLVSKTGAVEEAVVSQGDAALGQAAIDGVKRWTYRPFLVDGQAREIQSMIRLDFHDGVGKRAAMGPVSGPMAGMAVSAPQPVYPLEAKKEHVEGVVVLHALISKTGDIEDLKVVSGPQLLQQAAMDAVQRWKYMPYKREGVPVAVETTINVNFSFESPKKPDAVGGESAPAAAPDPK